MNSLMPLDDSIALLLSRRLNLVEIIQSHKFLVFVLCIGIKRALTCVVIEEMGACLLSIQASNIQRSMCEHCPSETSTSMSTKQ